MKKLLLAFVLAFAAVGLQAQNFKFGVKLGASTTTLSMKNSLSITEGGQTVKFDEGSMSLGFHAGLMSRLTLGKFVLQPEAYFSSVSGDVKLTEVNTGTITTVGENMTKLDIPVLAGVKLAKIFRVQAGPVASLVMSNRSGVKAKLIELLADDDIVIEDNPGSFTFGFQAGVGADISKLTIDLRYESNLNWLGSGLVVAGEPRQFDIRTSQILLSLGVLF